ncbi:condensation domain-containing protein [Streptomyces sp. S.PNR 29]|uniref:condensation domain-containing protein n=1 Tax=Streptomyces sp. S.PNR 29 TaxID=2973805 RepID=UPI0025B2545D|nr:condensation domain-containing protein [Streptomyces sp. S.PNR 29]MDN0193990.1 condensation domain-containing protein [Streptomyces sp. S.PNR 29]
MDATWSQREFWTTINKHRPDGFYQITWTVPVPEGRGLDDVLGCLRLLVERHQALRTKITEGGPAGLRQVVFGEGSLPVRIEDAPDEQGAAEAAEAVRGEFFRTEPRLDRDFPFKIAIVTREGLPRFMVFACSHVVLDGESVRVVEDELSAVLSQGSGEHLEPVTHQPEDQVRDESLDRSARTSQRSLSYWKSTLLASPGGLFSEVRGGRSPLWLGRLRSRALLAAELTLVPRVGVSSGALYLGAAACVLGEVTGKPGMTFRVPTSNRFTAATRSYVGALSQHAVITVDTTSGSFYDVVRGVDRGLRRAYSHARYDPDGLRRVIEEVEAARREPVDLAYLFNDLRDEDDKPKVGAPAVVQDAALAADLLDTSEEISWELLHAANSDIKVYVRVSGTADHGGLDVAADADCLTTSGTENILRAAERLIVRAAQGDFAADRVRAVSGL